MSTHVFPLPARPPRVAFGKLLLCEARVAWRVPLGLIFGVALPAGMVVVFGLIPSANTPVKSLDGQTVFSAFFPALIALALAALSLISLPTHLAEYRQQGILRRISTTPVPPALMLAAQIVINLALAAAALVIVITAGTAGFGLGAPRELGGFTLALALAVAAMFAIGLWISSFARTQSSANGIGMLLFYPMLFFAGLFFPRPSLPAVLRTIGDWTPLGAAVHALQNSMAGTFPSAQLLAVQAGYALVFTVLAVHFFRWE